MEEPLRLRFSVAYWTAWGDSLVVCGKGALMGNWDPQKGQPMTCHHDGQELIWEAIVEAPALEDFSYQYVVVNAEHKIVRRENHKRRLQVPSSLPPLANIELQDAWEVRSFHASKCHEPDSHQFLTKMMS